MRIKSNFKTILSISFILCITLIISCEKNEDATESADDFVGVYNYNLTLSGGKTSIQSGIIVIKKLASNRILLIQDGVYNTYYEVNENTITEESGQTTELYVSYNKKATFEESSTGTLAENNLTISGIWECDRYATIYFDFVCTKTF